MKKMFKILVIDDAFFMRILLKKTLAQKPNSDFEFEVIAEASNGKEGLDLYKICNADIVTVDINMPQLNGLEFLKKVRVINPNVKAIIISTTMNGSVKKELENKNTRYLPKSFQPEYLYKILDELAVSSMSKNIEEPKSNSQVSEKIKQDKPKQEKVKEIETKEEKVKEENKPTEKVKDNKPKEKVKNKKSLDDDFLLDNLGSIPVSNVISKENKPKENKQKENKTKNKLNNNPKKIETADMSIPLDFSSNLNSKDKNKNKETNKVKNNIEAIIFTDENIKLPKIEESKKEPSKTDNIKNIKEKTKTIPLEKEIDTNIYNHKAKDNKKTIVNEIIADDIISDEIINTMPLEIKEDNNSKYIKEDIIKEDTPYKTEEIEEDNSLNELEEELKKMAVIIDLTEEVKEEVEEEIILEDTEADVLVLENNEEEEVIVLEDTEELTIENEEEILIIEDNSDEEEILIIEEEEEEELLIIEETNDDSYDDIVLEDSEEEIIIIKDSEDLELEDEEILIIEDEEEIEVKSNKETNELRFFDFEKKDKNFEKKLSKEDELILSSKYSYDIEILNKVKDLEENEEEIIIFKETEDKAKNINVETPVDKSKELSALDIALKKLENFDLDNNDGEVIFNLENEEEENTSSSMDLELALKNLGGNLPEITIEDTDNLKDSANNLELNNRVKDYNPNINNKKSTIAPPRNKELLDIYSPKLEKMYNLKVEKEVITEPEKTVNKRGFFSRLFNFKKKK